MILLARHRLLRELERWRSCGHRPLFWWRDDDARGLSPALDRLTRVADGLPVSIAVIPYGVSPTLADWLTDNPAVTIAQHGVDHVNRRMPAEGSAADYSSAVAPVPLARGILAGRHALERAGLDPVFFTPPWNRVEPVLLEALAIAGYFVISGWNGEGADKPGFQRLDTHIDLLRWKGGARFRGAARLYEDLRRQLAERRGGGDFARPIGLLTHHLDHDEASWKFLENFLELLRPVADFQGFSQLAAG
jgi:hypothetical protein